MAEQSKFWRIVRTGLGAAAQAGARAAALAILQNEGAMAGAMAQDQPNGEGYIFSIELHLKSPNKSQVLKLVKDFEPQIATMAPTLVESMKLQHGCQAVELTAVKTSLRAPAEK